MLSARDQLLALESGERYVFHGSENPDIECLKPNQSFNFVDGVQEPDGEPMVFTSSKADYAILMALVNGKNCPKGFFASANTQIDGDGNPILKISAEKDTLEQLTEDSVGYVYVLEKSLFTQRKEGDVEYVSKTPVSPINKIPVYKKDLPPYLEVLENNTRS